MNDLKGIIEDCNKSDFVSKKVIEKVIKIIGQKRWNHIYDEESDICTTMGELIITLKGIPDLEKENTELKGLVNQYKACKCGNISLFNRNMIMSDQLDKAKEIIKILLKYDRGQFFDNRKIYEKYMHTRDEAEQFLKEIK